jgi:hypothetical protein
MTKKSSPKINSIEEHPIQKASKLFIAELSKLHYTSPYGNKYWKLFLPSSSFRKWYQLEIVTHDGVYFLEEKLTEVADINIDITGKISGIGEYWKDRRTDDYETVKIWTQIFTEALAWFKLVKKNWVEAHKIVEKRCPSKYKSGTVNKAIALHFAPKEKKEKDALTKEEIEFFVNMVDSSKYSLRDNPITKPVTAKLFFDYCKVAYTASVLRNREGLGHKSGKELYKILADGRHEGLLDIDVDSEVIFKAWLNGDKKYRDTGGHPFEISRNGYLLRAENYSNKEKINFNLIGDKEYLVNNIVRIAIAFHKKKMPFILYDYKGLRARVLNLTKVAITNEQGEEYENDSEEYDEDYRDRSNAVYNSYYLSEFDNNSKLIEPFIAWKSLPITRYK